MKEVTQRVAAKGTTPRTLGLAGVIVIFLLVISSVASAQPQPTQHVVTVTVWNANGTDYPQGTAGENGLTFECWLKDASNGWVESDHFTQASGDPGDFDYTVGGGLHDISIRVDKFTPFNWAAGDHIVIEAMDVEDPFNGETTSFEATITGNPEPEPLGEMSLPVELSSFTAQGGAGFVTLTWTTHSEVEVLGFNVYRSDNEPTQSRRINPELIKAAGSSTTERTYSYIDRRIPTLGNYYYRLECVDLDGTTEMFGPVSVTVEELALPTEFGLSHNYPNPFNPTTEIKYQLPAPVKVVMKIHGLLGKEIITLIDKEQEAGFHSVPWDGTDHNGNQLPSGVYILTMRAGDFRSVQKMSLVR